MLIEDTQRAFEGEVARRKILQRERDVLTLRGPLAQIVGEEACFSVGLHGDDAMPVPRDLELAAVESLGLVAMTERGQSEP